MTPAVKHADRCNFDYTLHEYAHDPGNRAFGTEAAAALNLDPQRVFKTLVVSAGGDLAVALVPVSGALDLKLLARAMKVKRVALADPEAAERATGYLVGGISPLGQKRAHPTWLDESVMDHPSIFVSAGRRGLEIELRPQDLRQATGARVARITR